jgi:transcriptional regulator with XRE-family HTH domain
MTQAQLAARAGVSQREVSRLERGRGAGTGVDVWAACGAAVDLQIAAFFEQAPAASLPRDIEHLRRQNLVVSVSVAGGWTAVPEARIDPGRWSRSIDVLLERAIRREVAVIEIWDLLLDGGEAMRGLEGKVQAMRERLGAEWAAQGLLVVRGTHRNRVLIRELGAPFAARYPSSSGAWLRRADRRGQRDADRKWLRVDQRRRRADDRGASLRSASRLAPVQHSNSWKARSSSAGRSALASPSACCRSSMR